MVSRCTKFHFNWSNISGTPFANAHLDQECKVEASLTLAWLNGLKFGVLGLFGVRHKCAKFHGHWTHLASTCFTRWPTGQKLKVDDALIWVMGFGSNFFGGVIWW